jgi:hypothetical protein
MAELSPLRRRMIEDMTVRNLSPATQQSYVYAVAKLSLFLVVHQIGSIWRMCGHFRFTWSPPALRGQRSIRSCVRCGFSTVSRSAATARYLA